jgi:hypothetical protein
LSLGSEFGTSACWVSGFATPVQDGLTRVSMMTRSQNTEADTQVGHGSGLQRMRWIIKIHA